MWRRLMHVIFDFERGPVMGYREPADVRLARTLLRELGYAEDDVYERAQRLVDELRGELKNV